MDIIYPVLCPLILWHYDDIAMVKKKRGYATYLFYTQVYSPQTCVRGVISDVHAARNDGFKFCFAYCADNYLPLFWFGSLKHVVNMLLTNYYSLFRTKESQKPIPDRHFDRRRLNCSGFLF